MNDEGSAARQRVVVDSITGPADDATRAAMERAAETPRPWIRQAPVGDERTLLELAYLLEAELPFPRIECAG